MDCYNIYSYLEIAFIFLFAALKFICLINSDAILLFLVFFYISIALIYFYFGFSN